MKVRNFLSFLVLLIINSTYSYASLDHFFPYHGFCATEGVTQVGQQEVSLDIDIDLKGWSFLRRLELRVSSVRPVTANTEMVTNTEVYNSDLNMDCDQEVKTGEITCKPKFESNIESIFVPTTSRVEVKFKGVREVVVLDHCRRHYNPTASSEGENSATTDSRAF